MNDLKNIIRFLKKVEEAGFCWGWKASTIRGGYGQFSVNYKNVLAHRFSYELFRGEIPEGMTLDHLCRNRACVNPIHLEIVTNHENILRGLTGKMNNHQTKKTHCPKGHDYIESNLSKGGLKHGKRICLICRRDYDKVRDSLGRRRNHK